MRENWNAASFTGVLFSTLSRRQRRCPRSSASRIRDFNLVPRLPSRLLEYLVLDMTAAMVAAGFAPPRQTSNSPKHATVVAVKR